MPCRPVVSGQNPWRSVRLLYEKQHLFQELVSKLNGFDLIGLAFVHQAGRQVVVGLKLLAGNAMLMRADVAAGHEEQRQAHVRQSADGWAGTGYHWRPGPI